MPKQPTPIYLLRDHPLLLDADLAALLDVPTKRLMEQIRRNPGHFPPDTCFRLTLEEMAVLRPIGVGADAATGGPPGRKARGLPVAFTLEGALLSAFVLNSPIAIALSILVVRLHCQLRDLADSSRQGKAWFSELEEDLDLTDPILADVWSTLDDLRAIPLVAKKRKRASRSAEQLH